MINFRLLLVAFITFASCQQKHSQDFTTVYGEIENNKDSLLIISNAKGVLKTISIDENGMFKDTLKVGKSGVYLLSTSPGRRAPIFLDNGFDLSLNVDAEMFMESITFEGEGSENSMFILKQIEFGETLGSPKEIFQLDKQQFDDKIRFLEEKSESLLNDFPNLDPLLRTDVVAQNNKMIAYFKDNYESQYRLAQQFKQIEKGKPSPKFEKYVDYKGGKKSLDSFKGTFVYIDIWATWCRPCINEIPSLQQLEKEFHGKNITFVSISTDGANRNGGSWDKAQTKWRNFVKERAMSGVQLWSGEDYSFQEAYQINAIPRFILIDPKGNIVDENAPRPSDPRLKNLLKELGI